MISKTDLRKLLSEKRRTLDTKILSGIICEKIKTQKEYIEAKNIFSYYPKPFEVDIIPLLKDKNKIWFLPKTSGDEMLFYEYKYGDNLAKGDFGVYEPVSDEQTKIIPDLIIVPALSVDKNHYRLGYGKGYYDRFLNNFSVLPKTLTPIFSELIIEKLPRESHDKKIDIIITD